MTIWFLKELENCDLTVLIYIFLMTREDENFCRIIGHV